MTGNPVRLSMIAPCVLQELPRVLADLELSSDLVAVVNPGRDGVGEETAAESTGNR